LDYGTNSVRCVIVDTADGRELGTCVYEYETGDAGIILDSADHNLARQNPADYLKGVDVTVAGATADAKKTEPKFDPKDVIGIGVDTTGSTPLPVDKDGTPLAMLDVFKDNPNAHAWLWKDHTGYAEAGTPRRPKPRRWPRRSIRSTWPSAAARIRRNGSSARSCIVCALRPGFSMRPIRGSSTPTGCPPC
jgi:ribulose kinase